MKKKNTLISAAAIASIACFLVAIAFQALSSAINIPTFHLDGAFQTASGLYRLDAGQAPGRDFFPYLGIGPLLLIFPFFKMAGATLFASVFAAKFVTLALGWVAISVLCQLFFRPRKALFSFAMGAAVFMGTNYLADRFFDSTLFAFAFEPGNSLRPARVALPYLVGLASYFLLKCADRGLRRNILAGLMIGLALLWSNDFAIPTAALFTIFLCAYFYVAEKATWKKSALTLCLAAMVSGVLLLTLVTAGHPLELIRYNFLDVANDQWWYFAPYGPSTRVFGLGQLTRLISEENHFPLIVLAATVLAAAKTRRTEHALLALIGLTLFSGGALASVGGHLGGYFGGFYYWGAATAVLAFLRAMQIYARGKDLPSPPYAGAMEGVALAAVFLIMLVLAAGTGGAYREKIHAAENDRHRFFVPEFDGYLGIQWKGYIDYVRQHRESKVIEEYWGIANALNRKLTPWPVDSVIHALGGVRKVAQSSLANADLIVSTRHATARQWQPWSVSQNFWFYEELLSEWTPEFVSPTTIVWGKMDAPRETVDVGCQVSKEKNSIILPPGSEGLYKVALNYTAAGDGRYLLMIRNNMSFGDDAGGFVSLSPGGSTSAFPVRITRESGRVLDAKSVGSSKTIFLIQSCRAANIGFEHDQVLPVESHEPAR